MPHALRSAAPRERRCIARAGTLAALSLLLLSIPPLRAQQNDSLPVLDSTATLAGRVVSAMTGGPLPNARVVLLGSGYGAFSDSGGAFRIPRVPAGLDTIEVSLIGYATARAPLALQKGATTTATLSLSQTVLRVEEIHVTVNRAADLGKLARFEEHRKNGLGYYITPQMIRDRHPQHPSDLLRMVPGLEVGPYNLGHASVRVVRTNENCAPPIYVDGILSPNLEIDDLSRDDLMAIEVYRGPSETPAQYQQGRNGCGAIVVWTQEGGSRGEDGG